MSAPQPAAEKKLRGIPRRLRALRKRARAFKDNFPDAEALAENGRYWNWKIPTDYAMLEGRQSTQAMKREIAGLLLQACDHLTKAKPVWAKPYRVTCLICLPHMFASEICIYLDEAYFQSKIPISTISTELSIQRICGTSLSQEWQLLLPAGMQEVGIQMRNNDDEPADVGQHWMFGELS